MKVILDRFEGHFAVCEMSDGNNINVEKSRLPIEVKEGDVLDIQDQLITVDAEATEKRRKEIADLTKDIWN